MDITTLKYAIHISHLARVPLFVWSARGMGKSSAPRQYCQNNFHFTDANGKGIVPFGLRDVRASQMEASEIRGIPKDEPDKNWFRYLPPIDLPQGEFIDERGNTWGQVGDKMPETSPFYDRHKASNGDEADSAWPLKGKVAYHQGILFLDEPNRGEDDVLQAIFQLVLDRKAGGYELPSGWGIMAAGNPSGSKYRVNTMISDAAFLSRWCHVSVERSDAYVNGWLNYMYSVGYDRTIMDKVTQFCASNLDHLVQNEQGMEELSIEPNPRSWEMVAKVEQVLKLKGHEICNDSKILSDCRREILQGLVGISISSAYIEWSATIYPKDILEGGITEEIRKKLSELTRSELQGLVWGVANLATSIKNPPKNVISNGINFVVWLMRSKQKDLAVAYAKALTDSETESSLKGLTLVNPSIIKLMNSTGKIKDKIWLKALTEDPKMAEELQLTAYGEKIVLK
jgi:hypothetical protein